MRFCPIPRGAKFAKVIALVKFMILGPFYTGTEEKFPVPPGCSTGHCVLYIVSSSFPEFAGKLKVHNTLYCALVVQEICHMFQC